VKIDGTYTLAIEQELAYTLLQDPDVLAKAMPGCKELVRTGENEYAMKMSMALASISGLFDGTVRVADQTPPESFRLIVEGAGKIGFIKGDGVLRLKPDGVATEVVYEGDVQVGGTIATVGQRLIGTTARMMIKRFFEKLTAEARTS
jgi:carbon monoxide dehydrogenase subunit G